jgi:hypothetical protein
MLWGFNSRKITNMFCYQSRPPSLKDTKLGIFVEIEMNTPQLIGFLSHKGVLDGKVLNKKKEN